MTTSVLLCLHCLFFFQAEDGIRDLVRSRGLGDVYKRQLSLRVDREDPALVSRIVVRPEDARIGAAGGQAGGCLLYTSDAADERSSVDLGGRRIIKKKNREPSEIVRSHSLNNSTAADKKKAIQLRAPTK